MKITVNRISLGIASIERAIRFYDTWLGIKPHKLSINQALYQLDNAQLALVLLSELADEAETNNESEGFSGVIRSHYVDSKKEVDRIMRIAVDAGAFVTKTASITNNGTYSGYFSDLDGHLWEVAYQAAST